MDDESRARVTHDGSNFSRQIGAQARRKLRAQRGAKKVWFGLGVSGMIGWSVAIPALLGAMLGVWVDRRYPSHYSWALMFLLFGIVLGCFNAWHWVHGEYQDMQEDADE